MKKIKYTSIILTIFISCLITACGNTDENITNADKDSSSIASFDTSSISSESSDAEIQTTASSVSITTEQTTTTRKATTTKKVTASKVTTETSKSTKKNVSETTKIVTSQITEQQRLTQPTQTTTTQIKETQAPVYTTTKKAETFKITTTAKSKAVTTQKKTEAPKQTTAKPVTTKKTVTSTNWTELDEAYYQTLRGVSTKKQRQMIIKDAADYAYKTWNGKRTVKAYDSLSGDTQTVTFSKPIKMTLNNSYDASDANLHIGVTFGDFLCSYENTKEETWQFINTWSEKDKVAIVNQYKQLVRESSALGLCAFYNRYGDRSEIEFYYAFTDDEIHRHAIVGANGKEFNIFNYDLYVCAH